MLAHQSILNNIARHIALEAEEQTHFLSLLALRQYRKRQFVLREGDICYHSIFVTSGCLRSYTLDDNGFEHVLQFAPPDWWMADMYSLLSGQPGQLNIEAMEITEALLLAKRDQEQLYRDIPKFERFFRLLTEQSLVANRRRVLDNLTLTARERYAQFCSVYPSLIYTLPQKQIAAYIGVTPEFLSKIRSEMRRSK